MSQGSKGSTTVFADDLDDDTIEMEFTAAQQLELSQAAEAATLAVSPAEPTPSVAPAIRPAAETSLQTSGKKRLRARPLILIAAVVAMTAAITWRVAGQMRGPVQTQPERVVVRLIAPPPPPPPAVLPQPAAPPIRVTNPFDVTEVFEFPAATSKTEAREAMAQILLARAQDRRERGLGISHAEARYLGRGASDKNPSAAAR